MIGCSPCEIRMSPGELAWHRRHVAGNKTYLFGVVCVVVEEGVCLRRRGGDLARAPRHVIRGRGVEEIHGQWGSSRPTTRTTLGAALLVPCRPRDRMGLRGASWKHARHQRERNVHRSPRSALGGRRLHRATDSPSPCKTRLFRETDPARTLHGGVRGRFRVRKPEALHGPAFLALRHRLLIPFYTKSADSLP